MRHRTCNFSPSAKGSCTVLQAGRSRVRIPMVSLEFFIDVILLVALWPGVDSASNRNKYQEYFLGVKAAFLRKSHIESFYLYPSPNTFCVIKSRRMR